MIKNLALVDDDYIYVLLTKRTLQQTNLVENIKVFGNGLEAIEYLSANCDNPSHLPEVILLDLSMPIMDGWQFMEEFILLKPRIGKKITIYIISSSITPSDLIKAREISEVSDYYIKPVSKEQFINLLRRVA
jgi:CheY-like chemotaxis protein